MQEKIKELKEQLNNLLNQLNNENNNQQTIKILNRQIEKIRFKIDLLNKLNK